MFSFFFHLPVETEQHLRKRHTNHSHFYLLRRRRSWRNIARLTHHSSASVANRHQAQQAQQAHQAAPLSLVLRNIALTEALLDSSILSITNRDHRNDELIIMTSIVSLSPLVFPVFLALSATVPTPPDLLVTTKRRCACQLFALVAHSQCNPSTHRLPLSPCLSFLFLHCAKFFGAFGEAGLACPTQTAL